MQNVLAGGIVILLGLGWLGYPAVLKALGPTGSPRRSRASGRKSVTVIVATRDDPLVIQRRVANLWETRYPADRVAVVVGIDWTARWRLEEYAAVLGDRAIIVRGDGPGGKAGALNAAVREATGDVLVFADSRQSFDTDTIPNLVGAVETGPFAAASGLIVQETGHGLTDLFWRYEVWLRRAQSDRFSLVTTSGAVWAMRRPLWEPVPPNAICDDLYSTMSLVMRGHRVGLCTDARAIDPRRLIRAEHFAKKVRTLTGLVQFIRSKPSVLIPGVNPIWMDFVAHKLLRLLTPPLTLLLAITLSWSFRDNILFVAPWAVGGLSAVILLAAIVPQGRRRLLAVLAMVATLWLAPLVALANGIRKKWQVWVPESGGPQDPRATHSGPAVDQGRPRV